MWSMQLEWKQDSNGDAASVDMQAAEAYFKANGGAEYRGNSADSKLTLWFENEPSQGEKDACQDYWDALGKDVDSLMSCTAAAMSLAADANYEVAVGDKVYDPGQDETREITVVTDQQNFTLDSAFTADPSSDACVICSPDIHGYVSQAQIVAAMDSARSSLQTKIEADDSYDTFSAAEKKLAAGMQPSKAELGL